MKKNKKLALGLSIASFTLLGGLIGGGVSSLVNKTIDRNSTNKSTLNTSNYFHNKSLLNKNNTNKAIRSIFCYGFDAVASTSGYITENEVNNYPYVFSTFKSNNSNELSHTNIYMNDIKDVSIYNSLPTVSKFLNGKIKIGEIMTASGLSNVLGQFLWEMFSRQYINDRNGYAATKADYFWKYNSWAAISQVGKYFNNNNSVANWNFPNKLFYIVNNSIKVASANHNTNEINIQFDVIHFVQTRSKTNYSSDLNNVVGFCNNSTEGGIINTIHINNIRVPSLSSTIVKNQITVDGFNNVLAINAFNNQWDNNNHNDLLTQVINKAITPAPGLPDPNYYNIFKDKSNVRLIDVGNINGDLRIELSFPPNTYYEYGVPNSQSIKKEIIISGFSNINSNPDIYTTKIKSPILVNGLNNLLPQQYNTNNNEQNQLIINELLKNNNIYSLPPNTKLTFNDIRILNVNSFDNLKGEVNVKVQILNDKAWKNGVIDASFNQNVTIQGFKQSKPTLLKISSIAIDDFWNKKITTTFNKLDALNFLNQHKTEIFNYLPDNTQIIIGDYDNTSGLTLGEINLKIDINKYYDDRGILVDPNNSPGYHNFKITGFLSEHNNPQLFTTIIPSEITINGFENLLAQDVINGYDLDKGVLQAIINKLLEPGVITNLVPNQTLTQDDLIIYGLPYESGLDNIGNLYNNKTGEYKIKVEIKNSKAWVNGQIQPTFSKVPVIVKGFKQQQPTRGIDPKSMEIPNVNNLFTNEYSLEQAKQFLNQPEIKARLFSNLPPDAQIIIKEGSFNNTSHITDGYILVLNMIVVNFMI